MYFIQFYSSHASVRGQSLLQMLDDLPKIARLLDVPLRMPITDRFKVGSSSLS